MGQAEVRVAIDVGCRQHRVAIGDVRGQVLEEFDLPHTATGIAEFFRRVERQVARQQTARVVVAMEGVNGWARPLDQHIQERGWELLNVNNLKLARFKEIFPGPAKSDAIDSRKMLELLALRAHVPVANTVLQAVTPRPAINEQLRRLTRRRRQLVEDKGRVLGRLQADLQAVCPGLVAITGQVDNRWFLHFLTCRRDLRQLARLRPQSLRQIGGVGRHYAAVIAQWQPTAAFGPQVEWVAPMVYADARRVLALLDDIEALEEQIAALAQQSSLAQRVDSIPGFGLVCSAELAGELGTPERFASEASLALYVGMAQLDNSSGQRLGSKPARQVNTRAKAAMMTAVDRHRKCVPQSQSYYDRKRAQGKTHNQAIRALGRHLVRVLWAMLTNDHNYELREPNTFSERAA
jgi:transposase